MARSRNIKPGFFSNEILAECKPLTRLLFQGLWCLADREGRLEDRPKKIKAEILPYDSCDVDSLLNELASKTDENGTPSFIIRYKIDGRSYIQVLNFGKHQNPHIKEAASTIPAPDEYSTSTMQESEENGSSHADSLLPITDSLLPIKDVFDNWNNQKITIHHELTNELKKTIGENINKFGIDNVITSIKRYGIVFRDSSYFFSYKWTLLEFLKRKNGLPSFLDEGEKWVNYITKDKPKPPPKPKPINETASTAAVINGGYINFYDRGD